MSRWQYERDEYTIQFKQNTLNRDKQDIDNRDLNYHSSIGNNGNDIPRDSDSNKLIEISIPKMLSTSPTI